MGAAVGGGHGPRACRRLNRHLPATRLFTALRLSRLSLHFGTHACRRRDQQRRRRLDRDTRRHEWRLGCGLRLRCFCGRRRRLRLKPQRQKRMSGHRFRDAQVGHEGGGDLTASIASGAAGPVHVAAAFVFPDPQCHPGLAPVRLGEKRGGHSSSSPMPAGWATVCAGSSAPDDGVATGHGAGALAVFFMLAA